jgi:oxygen-independent coproporphyrinogen-3 oxidase
MRYTEALIRDLESTLPLVWGRTVRSVFIGGGTPTLLSPQVLDRLLSELRARLVFAHAIEVTLEANPGTVDEGELAEYRALGINRLSLGVQSFQDGPLRAIGRIHDGQQAAAAVRAAQRAGFTNFNIDLMFGLPGQTPAESLRDVRTAVDSQASHISFYQLTIEPNTAFYQQPPVLPHEDVIWDIQQQAMDFLIGSGYEHYEISAFARSKWRCQHNMNYWLFGDYLGIGAGAHSKITDISGPSVVREWKIKHPDHYIAALEGNAFVAGRQILDESDLIAEYMLNALRLRDGFSIDQFEAATGVPGSVIAASLENAEARRLIVRQPKIRATQLGAQYLNELLQIFLPDTGEKNAVAGL